MSSTALRLSYSVSGCRTKNSTDQISWPVIQKDGALEKCIVQSRKEAERDLLQYLYCNLMPFDFLNIGTLGFSPFLIENERDSLLKVLCDSDSLAISNFHERNLRLSATSNLQPLSDGLLEDGIVGTTVQYALDAKAYPWTSDIPKDIYLEYVASFANTNEPRSNWRPLLAKALSPTINNLLTKTPNPTVERVSQAVNTDLWNALGGIEFQEEQTPLIFDTMSTIAFKYASYTGLSILFVDALRSIGVPARLAGTPAWNGTVENGNHSWVEVYCPSRKGNKWMFLEAAPAAGGVCTDPTCPPCNFWFCNKNTFDGKTQVYAARLDRMNSDGMFFPLNWDISNHEVPGENRTDIMTQICSQC